MSDPFSFERTVSPYDDTVYSSAASIKFLKNPTLDDFVNHILENVFANREYVYVGKELIIFHDLKAGIFNKSTTYDNIKDRVIKSAYVDPFGLVVMNYHITLEEESEMPVSITESEAVKIHEDICKELNDLYSRKNHDYGDSFHKTYMDWGITMPAIRLQDKVSRLCSLCHNSAQVADESIDDTLMDIANYAIMTLIERRRK